MGPDATAGGRSQLEMLDYEKEEAARKLNGKEEAGSDGGSDDERDGEGGEGGKPAPKGGMKMLFSVEIYQELTGAGETGAGGGAEREKEEEDDEEEGGGEEAKEEPTRRRNRKRRVRPSFQPPDSKSERDLKPFDFSHALAPVVKYHRMFGFGPVGFGMGSASVRAGPAPLTPPLPPSLARTETQICCRARPTPGEAEGEGECQEEAAVWQESRAVIGGARCMYAWGEVLVSAVSFAVSLYQ